MKRLGLFLLFASGAMALAGGDLALAANPPAQGLGRYVGKYPSQKVAGGRFLSEPRVVAAINAAVRDPEIRRRILSSKSAVEVPILALSAHRLFTRSFDPTGGGETNWAILITTDGKKAAVCWSTDAVYGDGTSTWFVDGEKAFDRSGPCPSEMNEIESSFGTWPVGGMPG